MLVDRVLFVSFLLFAVFTTVACNRTPPPTPPTTPPQPPPPRATSRFLNTDPEVRYVGTAVCAECHADQHATWNVTAHARSMSEVTPEREPPDAEFDHPRSGRRYEVIRVDGELRHRESLVLSDGEVVRLSDHRLKYLVGSGRFSRTYLVELDGFLVESPVTWYASRDAWDMSPGYDHEIHKSFRRRATHGCLHCHGGLVEPEGDHGVHFPFDELAIGCERCHGPGSLHVKARREKQPGHATGDEIDLTIVNPRHLDRELSEAICRQCHLQGEAKVVVRGRRAADYRPGLPLEDFRLEYRYRGEGPDMTVVGHVEQLQLSRCYADSKTLSCVTCHDPHDPHEPRSVEDRARFQRSVCLDCHALGDCREHRVARDATRPAADNCITCHMPQVPTDIPHIAFTHHRIAVHDQDQPAADPPGGSAGSLRPMQDESRLSQFDRDRNMGLAYLKLHFQRQWGHRAFLDNAADFLNRDSVTKYAGGAVHAARAEIAFERRDLDEASRLARSALATDIPIDAANQARGVLAQVLVERREFDEAAELLKSQTRFRRSPFDWALLGHCHKARARDTDAIRAFEHALSIAPGQGAVHVVLAELYARTGQPDRARHHAREAARLPANGFRPRSARR